jgi:hypothetical protein
MENPITNKIQKDKEILDDPTLSPQMRRHVEGELVDLESYHKNHPEKDEVPTSLELYCDNNPDALECRIYED